MVDRAQRLLLAAALAGCLAACGGGGASEDSSAGASGLAGAGAGPLSPSAPGNFPGGRPTTNTGTPGLVGIPNPPQPMAAGSAAPGLPGGLPPGAPSGAAGAGALPGRPGATPPPPPPPAMMMPPAPAVPVTEPRIPAPMGECPQIVSGNIMVMGQSVAITAGSKQEGPGGPVVFYWHGTGSSSFEVAGSLGAGNSDVVSEGGVIASFNGTTEMGQNTGNGVWYTGDFAMSDQILACSIQQLNIDVKRVYTAGCSAGGLQASAMVYSRSSYLAASMPNSGGAIFALPMDEPNHVPAIMLTHGAMGQDVVGIDFSETSITQAKDIAAKGGVAYDCDHGGGHCSPPGSVTSAQWQFLVDHPFGAPDPYLTSPPANLPSICKRF